MENKNLLFFSLISMFSVFSGFEVFSVVFGIFRLFSVFGTAHVTVIYGNPDWDLLCIQLWHLRINMAASTT